MLHRWLKMIEQSNLTMDKNSAESCDRATAQYHQTSSIDIAANSSRSDISVNKNQSNNSISPILNTPFRKKAITSIERTRKLSILLKHQRYLVSLFINLISDGTACNHLFLLTFSFFVLKKQTKKMFDKRKYFFIEYQNHPEI